MLPIRASDEKLRERIGETIDSESGNVSRIIRKRQPIIPPFPLNRKKVLGIRYLSPSEELGILGKSIADKSITEVMINGYDCIFVEKAGKLQRIPDKFESQERLRNVITKFDTGHGEKCQ